MWTRVATQNHALDGGLGHPAVWGTFGGHVPDILQAMHASVFTSAGRNQ